ncbi:Wadjet anti-phage system protein JetA family protein [Undibacterium luofuense]|uniref:Uncharacterized protein n=1 Tax=Undibacterium luofuense TaxID=2828733 RepID=A0A941I4L0_9BURK|nr:Wadjet anti-phage system protein JetA family protein [Undibacterium luofuense]MBR7780626.1 hypothetical protein [Undibacterium luofuense]
MNLFDRLPPGIFNPLTGRNNRRTWELFVRLSERFFGPDSVPPFPDGYLLDQVTKEVERFLLDHDWDDGEEITDTPIAAKAAELVTRLSDTGWLIKEKIGMRTFISMRPTVMRFFETLQQFATEDPQHIGGSIQLVYSQLQSVQKDPQGQAAGFATAAQVCARMINSLNATTIRARDLMKDLIKENTTPGFIKRFFAEHIGELYVRDFKQLRTENHPLSLRFEIIHLVTEVTSNEIQRAKILTGYVETSGLSPVEAELALDRDVDRFRRLLDVETFLERMDRVMEAATQRALAFINYRLKASDRLEYAIEDTLNTMTRMEKAGLEIEGRLLPAPPIVSEARLQLPRPAPIKPKRLTMLKRELTLQQKAMHELRRAMIASRDMSPAAAKRFIESILEPGQTLNATEIPIKEVRDAVSYLGLMRIAAQAERTSHRNRNPLMQRLGFNAKLNTNDKEKAETDLFITPNFSISRKENYAP